MPKAGRTYAEAGVDVEAGDAFVRHIAPLVAATARKGSRPDLKGFAGAFDLKACGFDDPLLLAATDGVGTKLRIAIDTGRHGTIGQDLVAMCVNDLIVRVGLEQPGDRTVFQKETGDQKTGQDPHAVSKA